MNEIGVRAGLSFIIFRLLNHYLLDMDNSILIFSLNIEGIFNSL